MPSQEKGIRPSNALPYEIYGDGKLSADKKTFEIFLEAKNNIFGENTAGVPFMLYSNNYKGQDMLVTSYAVLRGDSIKDSWNIDDFKNSNYHIILHGANGFLREFIGNNDDPRVTISCTYQYDAADSKKLTGNIEINLHNEGNANTIEITDHYTKASKTKSIALSTSASVVLDLTKTYGWYDFTVKVKGNNSFEKRYAGRVETGKESFTDPMMGRVIV
jgi:phospholipase C